MKTRLRLAPCGFLLLLTGLASAQTAPPPPAFTFAPSNLTEKGVRSMAANCAACHGTEGRAVPGASVPGLAGRARDDIYGALTQFKEGKRAATLMHQIAKGYTDAEIAAMADYFSRLAR